MKEKKKKKRRTIIRTRIYLIILMMVAYIMRIEIFCAFKTQPMKNTN